MKKKYESKEINRVNSERHNKKRTSNKMEFKTKSKVINMKLEALTEELKIRLYK